MKLKKVSKVYFDNSTQSIRIDKYSWRKTIVWYLRSILTKSL